MNDTEEKLKFLSFLINFPRESDFFCQLLSKAFGRKYSEGFRILESKGFGRKYFLIENIWKVII